ncbi:MAG TPA: hypothetical protein VGL53_01580 [Bryobacteraceae bacterium]|jgi:2-polyprenyl-6-methoxyphenol hydroxylase-like FAD-dependent oxidoreductase
MDHKGKHAIVIGGSMGGLLAARVLADHFETVTLIDRDLFPDSPEHRRGVPQSRHTHGLLASGRRALERFFPGFSQEMLDAGALSGDMIASSKWFFEGGLFAKFPSELTGFLLSRPLIEYLVRKRVRSIPNVKFMEGTIVTGLLPSAIQGNARVAGVRLEDRELKADLVVDASGRASDSLDWLESLGYEKPPIERVEIGLGYTTRLFRRRSQESDGDIAVVIPANRAATKGGVMLAQEGDRWTVTLFSYFKDYAPSDIEGFREYARHLPYREIYNVIRDAEPIGEPYTARFPASVRKHYEHLDRFPQGFLAFGDSISSFNPTFGQGMSTAALEAVELDEALRAGLSGLAPRFFKKAAKVIDIPWTVSVGADLNLPCTRGPRNAGVRFINWYVSKLHKAAHREEAAALAFQMVANMLAPPPSILHPKVVWKVFKGNVFARRERPAALRTSKDPQEV